MKPGPQPKPTNLRLLQGNPSKRPIDVTGEVNPKIEIPDAPKHLNAEARKEWKRITVELEEHGLITNLDRAALALYCQAWGRLAELETALQKRMNLLKDEKKDPHLALVSYTPNGYEVQSVQVQLINTAQDQVNRYLQSFGLSPSSRGRVRPSTPQGTLPGFEAQGFAKFAR